jgi:hypothetical protein
MDPFAPSDVEALVTLGVDTPTRICTSAWHSIDSADASGARAYRRRKRVMANSWRGLRVLVPWTVLVLRAAVASA